MPDEPTTEPQAEEQAIVPEHTAHTPEAPEEAARPPEEEHPAPDESASAADDDASVDEDDDSEANGTADEPPSNKRWYVVKVQSGREESIKDAIERRVKIEGLEEFFGQIVIPTEKVVEMVKGKRVTKQRKLYPGYLMVEVEYNDRMLYLFRETSGVGDFVGASGPTKPPPPMSQREIDRIIRPVGGEKAREEITPKFERGDRVKVLGGPFQGMEGEVNELLEAKEKVRVELVIWNRPVPVELEYWQVEKV